MTLWQKSKFFGTKCLWVRFDAIQRMLESGPSIRVGQLPTSSTNQLIIWRVSIFEVGHLCNRFCSSFPDYLELACIFSFERHLSTKNYSTRERKRKLIIIWWRSQQHLHLVIFSISPNHHLMLCYVMLYKLALYCLDFSIWQSVRWVGLWFYPFWFKSFGLWWIICCIWLTFDPSLFCGLIRRWSLWWSTRWPSCICELVLLFYIELSHGGPYHQMR